MFKEKLKEIADQIDEIIKNDDFPSQILPEYLKQAVKDYPERGGKRLRPALLMWSCGLCGGIPENAQFAAVAAEIYHNWTLVHDDIIDNDDLRRGKPTTHTEIAKFAKKEFRLDDKQAQKFGNDMALLTGDIQQGWAVNMLLRSTEKGVAPGIIMALTRRLQELVNRELISGEALDVEFSFKNRDRILPEDVEKMLSMKTGALLQFCAESGAVIALEDTDYNNEKIEKLGNFAKFAGIAFQLHDDWLGIFGAEEELGKPICSDLSESKPTLILITALSKLKNESKDQLLNLLGKKSYSSEEINTIKALFIESTADKIINDKAMDYINKAKNILMTFPDNQYRQLLLEWTAFLVGRSK